jgi:hypothetical protein
MKKLFVTCDSQLSPLCKLNYIRWSSDFYKNRRINNGKYICLYCSRSIRLANNTFYHKIERDSNFFENVDSEIKAYLLGLIAGDGSISKSILRIVANPKDIETLNLFKTHVSTGAKIKKYKHQNCYFLDITSSKICADVIGHLKIDYGKKSDKIQLPDLPEQLLWHFIRGLMDSDGSISNICTSKISFPSCNYASKSDLIKNQIKALCDRYNIKYTCDKIIIRFNGTNAINFLNKVYENSTVNLKRKKQLYDMAITWVPQKGSPYRPRKTRKDKGSKKIKHD